MKRFTISVLTALLLVALMYPNPFAQIPMDEGITVPVGIKFGPIMQPGVKGALGGFGSIAMPMYIIPVLGDIVRQPEIGFFFADRPFESQTLELNSWRIAETRQFGLGGGWWVGPTGSLWHVINSNGGDSDIFGYGVRAGWMKAYDKNGIQFSLGGEILTNDDNKYWVYAGFTFFNVPQ